MVIQLRGQIFGRVALFLWKIALTRGLGWRRDELYKVEVDSRTGYVICRTQCEMKLKGSLLKN